MRSFPTRCAVALFGTLLLAAPAATAGPPPPTPTANAPARAAGYFTEYALPAGAKPWSIDTDNQGLVWFTLDGPRAVGYLNPATGNFYQYAAPSGAFPYHIKAYDGFIWYTDFELEARNHPGRVLQLDAAWNATRAFPLPDAKAGPAIIAADAHGGLWVTEMMAGRVIRLDMQTGVFDPEWQPPATDTVSGQRFPYGHTFDSQGGQWVAESGTNRLTRIGPGDAYRAYALPPGFYGPSVPAIAADGRVWVSGHATNAVAALEPASGRVEVFPLHPPEKGALSAPADVRVGPDGSVWVMEHEANRLARILPREQTLVEYPLPQAGSDAQWLALDAKGNVWYAAHGTDRIGRLAADAPYYTVAATFPTGTASMRAGGIITGTLMHTAHGALPTLGLTKAPEGFTANFELASAPDGLTATFDATGHFTIKAGGQVKPGQYRVLLGVRTSAVLAATPVTITVRPTWLAQYWWVVALGAAAVLAAGAAWVILKQRQGGQV